MVSLTGYHTYFDDHVTLVATASNGAMYSLERQLLKKGILLEAGFSTVQCRHTDQFDITDTRKWHQWEKCCSPVYLVLKHLQLEWVKAARMRFCGSDLLVSIDIDLMGKAKVNRVRPQRCALFSIDSTHSPDMLRRRKWARNNSRTKTEFW